MLNLEAMPLGARARLVARMATTFGCPIYEVEEELKKTGFPIRAVDVIVSMNLRAFV